MRPDAPGTTAVLRVTTELDMAGTVVFGCDESLGDGIATDADMGGGAHPDRQVGFSADFRASAAVDGNVGTEWSSAGDGDDAFLTLDLGRAVSVVVPGEFTGQVLRIDADRATGGTTDAGEIEIHAAP